MCLLLSLALGLALQAAASPVPESDPTPPPLAWSSSTASPNCTTWLTAYDLGFRGDWTPEVAWTVYTSTVTAYSYVTCKGCQLSITTTLGPAYGGIGPEEKITGTTTPSTPATVTSTVCYPESAAPDSSQVATSVHPKEAIPRRDGAASTAAPVTSATAAAAESDCTMTQLVGITPTFGPVRTIRTKTETVTSRVDCSGCAAVATRVLDGLNPGPVVIFNSTTTVTDPAKTTTYVCKKSGKHQDSSSTASATTSSSNSIAYPTHWR